MSGPLVILPTGAWGGRGAHAHHGWSPQLAAWIGDYLRGHEDVPVHDFGCGLGHYLAALEPRGFTKLTGYERERPDQSIVDWALIREQDLAQPFDVAEPGNVLFLEVAEHVPRFFEHTLLHNVARATRPGGTLIMSWAVRGQGGDGHVNELDNYEVAPKLETRGFALQIGATHQARSCITNECPWFRHTLMVWQRQP